MPTPEEFVYMDEERYRKERKAYHRMEKEREYEKRKQKKIKQSKQKYKRILQHKLSGIMPIGRTPSEKISNIYSYRKAVEKQTKERERARQIVEKARLSGLKIPPRERKLRGLLIKYGDRLEKPERKQLIREIRRERIKQVRQNLGKVGKGVYRLAKAIPSQRYSESGRRRLISQLSSGQTSTGSILNAPNFLFLNKPKKNKELFRI